jgi:hypothetical protein
MSETTTQPEAGTQIPLPYETLGKIATRQNIRDVDEIKQISDGYKVPYPIIVLRPDFNIRIRPDWMDDEAWEKHLEVEALANDIMAGKDAPEKIKGDFVVEDGVLKFIITDGERRYRAIGWLLRNGHTHYKDGTEINMVEVEPNPRDYTEWDRLRQQHATNNNMKYTTLEYSVLCTRKKKHFLKNKEDANLILSINEIPADQLENFVPISNSDIAKDLNKSRQWVEDMLLIDELPETTRKAIASGKTPYSEALKAYRKELKDKAKEKQANTVVADVVSREGGEVIGEVKGNGQVNINQPLGPEDTPFDDERTSTSSATEMNAMDEVNQPPVFTGNHTVVESNAALKAEEESHKTRATYQDNTPKHKSEEAILADFKDEKELCDMDLNEVIKLLDKLTIKLGYLPDNAPGIKQTKDDCLGLVNGLIIQKVKAVQERIKKAPDRGTV